jgi:transcriptional regulator with XRE-family HTH domain
LPNEDAHARAKVSFGLRIVEIREARGLTQKQLAARAYYSVRQINRLEAGKTTVDFEKLVDLALALSVTLEELCRPPALAAERLPGNPRRRRKPAKR